MRPLAMILCVLLFPACLFAATVQLPETGQVTCTDAAGAIIDCAGTGQDGDILAGVEWPAPRFADNGNGTVTDNLTGLIWLKNANCFSYQSWNDALNLTGALANGQCGLTDGSAASDWRLPNYNELKSLVNREELNSATWLTAQGFLNTRSYYYFTSSTYASDTTGAWGVLMSSGRTLMLDKSAPFLAWPVRTGPAGAVNLPQTGQVASYATGDDGDTQLGVAWPNQRFTDNSDGTITDNLTGLTWLQDADCITGSWTEMLDFANTLGDGTCNLSDGSVAGDWRMPNQNELSSLNNIGELDLSSWLVSENFANVLDLMYWTSDTYAYDPLTAWGILMPVGEAHYDGKGSNVNILPVKGGMFVPPQIGVFRDGPWFLDANGNGAWDSGTDVVYAGFGQAGDLPVAGDWNGTGSSLIGVFRDGAWFLDANGNGAWDSGIDTVYASFGQAGDIPFVGDWDGDGFAAEIGVFRDGAWFFDANNNGAWDDGIDTMYASFGQAGDIPVIGDWDGDGIAAEIGVFRNGAWFLDANANGAWDDGIDTVYASFGQAGDIPFIGDWNSNGRSEIGVFRGGYWFLDVNGSGTWGPADKTFSFGQAGDFPLIGRWPLP